MLTELAISPTSHVCAISYFLTFYHRNQPLLLFKFIIFYYSCTFETHHNCLQHSPLIPLYCPTYWAKCFKFGANSDMSFSNVASRRGSIL